MNYRKNMDRRRAGFPEYKKRVEGRHFVQDAATRAMIERDAARVRLAEYLGVTVTSVPVDVPLGCDPAKSYAVLLEGQNKPIPVHYRKPSRVIQKNVSA